ncbi:bZIP transcription factor [Spirosoma jeollabukense]
MKPIFIYQTLLLCAVSLQALAQAQIVTPDEQPLYFQALSGSNNLLISQSTTFNTFVGRGAGQANTTGAQNTFLGYQAGFANTASSNTFLGYQTGNKTTTGNNNLFIGQQAGFLNTTGASNVFAGTLAGYSNINGGNNVFIGPQAGANNAGGSFNMFFGSSSGALNVSGSYNMAIGSGAGYKNQGNQNTFVGTSAGLNSQSGNNNVFIGQEAGTSITGGSNNTFVGWQANAAPSAGNITNAGAIGAGAVVSASNALVLGNNAMNIGIGATAPANKLEITQGTPGKSGLRFTNLTSAYTTTVLNQTKFLTVDTNGDVILASINGSGRVGADTDGAWQASGDNLQNTNPGGVVIGPGVSKTPAGYRLYVADGILTEKVKVAVKSTNDWSDKVFESGYKLKSLGEVEQYITKAGHLPGVPSASEVVEQGVDVAKMDAKLLEKIEELTLHMINMEKRINALTKENQSLKQGLVKMAKTRSK